MHRYKSSPVGNSVLDTATYWTAYTDHIPCTVPWMYI